MKIEREEFFERLSSESRRLNRDLVEGTRSAQQGLTSIVACVSLALHTPPEDS
jgi:hypothetical protein